jgi:hypothetical protein
VKESDLVRQSTEVVLGCLGAVPSLRARPVDERGRAGLLRADALLAVNAADGEHTLVLEAKASGEPRVARGAANQLLLYTAGAPRTHGVFVAPYVSERSSEILRQAGIGYADLAGNCHLSFGQVFIERSGRPNLFSERRPLRSLFAPKAQRVLRVLMADPKRSWRLAPLATEARVSLGQVHKVKQGLFEREWAREGPDGLSLAEPAPLLASWASNYSSRPSQPHLFYSLEPLGKLEACLAEVCKELGRLYAFTGFSAAARYAPFVRYQRASAYISGELGVPASSLGLKEVSSGANLSLLSPYDDGVYYGAQDVGGVRVVSPLQAYLDLQSGAGRTEEAANYLLERVLQPSW